MNQVVGVVKTLLSKFQGEAVLILCDKVSTGHDGDASCPQVVGLRPVGEPFVLRRGLAEQVATDNMAGAAIDQIPVVYVIEVFDITLVDGLLQCRVVMFVCPPELVDQDD